MVKKKKSFVKRLPGFRSGKWWKMILASIGYFFIFLIILGLIFGGSEYTEQKELSIEEIKNTTIDISYDTLMRHNEDYIGEIVHFKGRVVQVTEIYKDEYKLRVATGRDEIWVNHRGERLLEDDIIDLWSKVKGLKTYNTVLGTQITIPEVESIYIELT